MWDDPYGENLYGHVEKEYRHGPWKGMEPRQDWNSLPSHKMWHTCTGCGYKWSQDDFTYALNQTDYPTRQSKCWNCYKLDSDPEYMRKVWEKVDNNGKPPQKPSAKLEQL